MPMQKTPLQNSISPFRFIFAPLSCLQILCRPDIQRYRGVFCSCRTLFFGLAGECVYLILPLLLAFVLHAPLIRALPSFLNACTWMYTYFLEVSFLIVLDVVFPLFTRIVSLFFIFLL